MAHVYVFEAETGLVKIGYTVNPEERIKKIQTSSGFKITQQFISPLCSNYREVERNLHKQFADHRHQGEWFAIDFQTAVSALNQQVLETGSSTTQSLVAFHFEQNEVRTFIDEKGDTWFIAKDACGALKVSWRGNTLSNIPDSWRIMRKFRIILKNQYGEFGEVEKDFVLINEAALYKLAFRSNKPEADRFVNWVASEVLPAIRKTGKYEVNSSPPILTRRPEYQDFDNFVAECFIADSAGLVSAGNIYTAYKEWCQRGQRPVYSHKLLGQYLKEMSYVPVKRTHGKFFWLGMRLKLQTEVALIEENSPFSAKIADLQDYLCALCQLLETDEQYKKLFVLLKTAVEKSQELK